MSQPAWYRRLGRSGRHLSLDQRHYERGLAYYAQNQLDLAIADLDQAIELSPRNGEYYAARGLLLTSYDVPGAEEDAENDFARSLSLDPTQWLAHYGRGILAFRKADYDAAISHFSRAQMIAPQRPEVYFYRAIAFFQNENIPEATADMRYALSLLPERSPLRTQAEKWSSIFSSP